MDHNPANSQLGFTIPEVIVAAVILIILAAGTLSAYDYAIKVNRGNNIRAQAMTVLQQKVEEYRSYRFVPGTTGSDPPDGTDSRLYVGTHTTSGTSIDGIPFTIAVEVDNDLSTAALDGAEVGCKFKQIKFTAVLTNPETGWLANLSTSVTILRVRTN